MVGEGCAVQSIPVAVVQHHDLVPVNEALGQLRSNKAGAPREQQFPVLDHGSDLPGITVVKRSVRSKDASNPTVRQPSLTLNVR